MHCRQRSSEVSTVIFCICIAKVIIVAIILRQMVTLPTVSTFAEIQDREWYRIDLGGETISADGSDFYIVAQDNPIRNRIGFVASNSRYLASVFE